MKLYLSSFHIGDKPELLTNLVGGNKKTAVIANALDFSDDIARRNASIQKEMADLKSLGLEPEELDLRSYFGKGEELAKKMSEFGLLWVYGGNTFVLRRAFAESGLDEWLASQKSNKEFVYGGFSAGVCVLSPSLKGSDLTDDPNVVPEGYKPEIIWDGLGLISFAFAPHYKSNHPESESMDREVEYYTKNKVEFRALHDGEVIIQET